jgi:hypothetical protein
MKCTARSTRISPIRVVLFVVINTACACSSRGVYVLEMYYTVLGSICCGDGLT